MSRPTSAQLWPVMGPQITRQFLAPPTPAPSTLQFPFTSYWTAIVSFIPWRKMLFQSIQPKIPPGQFPFAFTATLLCLLWSTAIYQGTQTSIQHFQPTANRWVSQDTWQWDEEVTISWHRVLIESRLNHWQWKRRTACGRKVCSEKAPLRHWSTHCSFCVACTSLFKVDKNTKVFKSHTLS